LVLDAGTVVIDDHDVTRAIRTAEMDAAAATVARLPEVRAVLVERQRALAGEGGIVMEGRDIGTVVFPGADLKLYLDASAEERARRRAGDAAHTGGRGRAVSEVASALQDRDRQDSTRAVSPLTIAPDAVRMDTTGVPIEDVVQTVLELARSRLAG
jgi:cytidylate kinase